jgi:hypothetical protein
MLKSDSMIPQYHEVRTDHGDSFPFGKMLGQLPVEVRTPAKRAACYISAYRRLHKASEPVRRKRGCRIVPVSVVPSFDKKRAVSGEQDCERMTI